MKVQCTKCSVKLNIPDDKLEPDVDFTFPCPKCGEKNTVRLPGTSDCPEPAPTPIAPPTASQLPTRSPLEASPDLGEDGGGIPEFFEEGARPALICFEEGPIRDNLVDIVEKMNFVPIAISKARDALRRIRLTQFRMILLSENFDGMSRENNALLRVLRHMETPMRRRIFLALFGSEYQTFDQMTAFALSVNLIINFDDKAHFDKILYRGYLEYERFYKVYFDVLREMGKI